MLEEAGFVFAAREHPPGGELETWYVYFEPKDRPEVLANVDLAFELKDPSRANAERVASFLREHVRCLAAHYTPLGTRDGAAEN